MEICKVIIGWDKNKNIYLLYEKANKKLRGVI